MESHVSQKEFLDHQRDSRERVRLLFEEAKRLAHLKRIDPTDYALEMVVIKNAIENGQPFNGFSVIELREILIQCQRSESSLDLSPGAESKGEEEVERYRHEYNAVVARGAQPQFKQLSDAEELRPIPPRMMN